MQMIVLILTFYRRVIFFGRHQAQPQKSFQRVYHATQKGNKGCLPTGY